MPAVAAFSGIVLAPMTAADLPPVLEIERVSFPSPWTPAMFLQELDLALSRVIVARSVDAPTVLLGYLCRWIVADEVQVLNIAVAPGARRRGVAGALLAEVRREARARGCAAVILEVRRSNVAARAFYSATGFEEVGVRSGYYARDEDALMLRCVLTHG